MFFRPIFKNPDGSDIVCLEFNGDVLVALTETGTLYRIEQVPDNAYGHGERYVFGQHRDGEGDLSEVANTIAMHELYRAVVALSPPSEAYTVVSSVDAYGGSTRDKIKGVFTSPSIVIDQDFGVWSSLEWTQLRESGTRVLVGVKVAENEDGLSEKEWYWFEEDREIYYGYSNIVTVTRDLERFNIKGNALQFRVVLETDNPSSLVYASSVRFTYLGKHSVYFFSSKFRLERGSGPTGLILTGSQTTPKFTEVKYGVVGDNSVDWSEYHIIDTSSFESFPQNFRDTVKIGIKLSSQSLTNIPTVHEFSFGVDSSTDTRLNDE